MMKAIWINGWGLSESYTKNVAICQYPSIEHEIIQPRAGWHLELERKSEEATVIGYSLGAFLLLGYPGLAKKFKRTLFLAPFEDFKIESGRGGKVRLGQLAFLRRWLKVDKAAAMVDFKNRAGFLDCTEDVEELFEDDLIWGIDRLINDSLGERAIAAHECWIGAADALLNANQLKRRYPNINLVPGVGHDIGELLNEAGIAL